MKKRVLLKKILLTLLIGAGLFFITSSVSAQIQPGLNEIASPLGLGTQDIRVTIANIIRVALGLLGIVAVVIIIYGGVLYLTSMGEPEKIKKAKDLLIAAIIGLVIILTSFAIASFIISSILNATGVGPGVNGVIIPTCEETGTCPPPPWPGCADPDTTSIHKNAPFICNLDPKHGPKGQFVTIQGGKFGSYLATYTKVFFRQGSTDYEATVALCNGQPSWNDNQIVVEVPNNLPFNVSGSNNFKVVVKIEGYDSSEKSTGGFPPNDQFTLDEGQPGPGIACIVPDSGKENTAVNVFGKRFGATQDFSTLRFFGSIDATVTTWADELLNSSVPVGAKRGNVYVRVNGRESNGYGFIVTCEQDTDCGSGCCFDGYFGKECADLNYCLPGPNQSCDTDINASGCQAGDCQTGLFCDVTKGCTCQPAGPGTPCDRDPLTPSCELDNNKCGQGLYCSVHATLSCTCQYLPRIDDVQPRDGAPGNFITLWGRGFGSSFNPSRTKVIFLGDTTDPTDDKDGIFPVNCSAAQFWQDTQVIVAIPDGAKSGPLKLTNIDFRSDTTDDDNGWQGDFTINAIIRPGLCGASPDYGAFSDSIDLSGNNFGTAGQSLIGGTEFNKGSTWSWTNITISDVTVPNILTGVLPVQVKVGTENSNPVNFTVTLPALLPRIDYVDPTSGPTDQYVTIFGANFGIDNGTVRFANGERTQDKWALANTIFPDVCKLAGYWHDKYIVVKVPGDASIGASQIVVRTNDKYGGYFSNAVPFTHNNAKAGPGICAITPDQGPIGLAGVTLYGEKFGTYGVDNSKVKFWESKLASDAASAWSDTQVGSGTSDSGSMIVPIGAITGPVQLTDQAGILSNKISFTVGDCRQDKTLCSEANPCCDPRDGVCKSQSACQIVYPAMCAYNWSFTTGKMPVTLPPPQVIEDKTCIDNTQSPTPWKKSVDNCANIWISARFDQKMDISTLTAANIKLQACNTDNIYNQADCRTEVPPLLIDNFEYSLPDTTKADGFSFQPNGSLIANTWYLVTLKSDPNLKVGIKGEEGLYLDGNFDDREGGDYTWYFRIRNTQEACDVDKVVVAPQQALISLITDKQQYNAFALANNCNILDGNAYDWNWYKDYSDLKPGEEESAQCNQPTPPDPDHSKYCFAKITEETNICQAGYCKYSNKPCTADKDCPANVTYKQNTIPPDYKQGLTFVGAEVFKDDALKNRKDDNNKLVIDLNIPEITSFYPPDGLVRPEVNTYVTLYGKHFGKTQGSSQVLFDDIAAPLADCDKAWSDEIIKVKVPLGQPTTAGAETTYQLPSSKEKKDGMVVFYDFEESGNVIVKDKIDGLDGEIKGAPQRVSDQFGQAMQLNGTADYIKLPNQNLDTGSLEFWFKPQEKSSIQVLFSATDGTANNLFDIYYESLKNTRNLVKLSQWNYLAYTYDDTTSTYKLYVNGTRIYKLDGTGLAVTENFIGSNKNNILIGAVNTGTFGGFYNGLIDNFAIYSNILSADETAQHFGTSKGQVLFLKFDEDGGQILDSSANKLPSSNIVISNPAINFRTDQGYSGKAATFNGSNFISINNDPSLAFNQEISVEGWIKPTENTTQIFYLNNNTSFSLITHSSGPVLRFTVFVGNGENNSSFAVLHAQTDDIVKLDQWNYFAGTYDGQKVRVYLNGQKTEFEAPGFIYQNVSDTGIKIFNSACLGACYSAFSGSLDEMAIYNRVLSDAEISSRLGAKDNSHLIVKTDFGQATSQDTFAFSNNVYPFLCQLTPDFGLAGTSIKIDGDNLGDSNKTTFKNIIYGVGSYMHFAPFGLDILAETNIKAWANKLLNVNNPYSEVNDLTNGNPVISISASIDPYSEPYNPTNYSIGSYTSGDAFADTNGNGTYDKVKYKVGGVTLPVDALKSNSLPFALPPVITSITPDNGPIKTWVTIKGYNFGTNPGKVYFYNNQVAGTPPEPCENTWTNTRIIAVVPDGAISGEVYVETAPPTTPPQKLQSNKVNFSVNDNPLGAGLCAIFTGDNQDYAYGSAGDTAYALGDRFGEIQASSQLIFNANQNSTIAQNGWSNNSLEGIVPVDATSGNVVVTKKIETGRVCAGFHIGSWCPGGDISKGTGYDIIYQDVPSNPLYFSVNKLGCSGNLGTDSGLAAGYPIKPFDNNGPSSVANTALIATDGQYLYTKSYGSGSYAYGLPADTIYKIGTGFGNTKAGEIVKVYSLATGSNPAPMYSMTYHSDGKFYAGADYTTGAGATKSINIARLIFYDNGTYRVSADASIPEKLYDISGNEPEPNTKGALITSNGNLIFNVGFDFETGGYVIKNIKVKIFDPANNWQVVKKFEIPTDNLAAPYWQPRGGAGLVADNNFIYLFPPDTQDVLAIDWQNQGLAQQWHRDHVTGSLYEISGQFDWQNKVFWLGERQVVPKGLYNNIYKYKACPLAGTCQKDEDCQACGIKTSKCINGMCQPYIKDFIPVSGAVGNYTLLTGCYFGCNPGTIYFTGQNKTNLLPIPTNTAAYFPLNSDINDYSINHYPNVNLYTCEPNCTVSNPSAYLANGAIFDGTDYVKAENVQIQPSFTALAWAKSDTNKWNTDGWIVSSRDANGFIIHPNVSTKTWDGYIISDKTNEYTSIGRANIDDITQWHQYGVMYDASTSPGKASMIFDGQFVVKDQAMNIARGSAIKSINIFIGADSPPQESRFGKGMVSEVRLYNSVLSETDIKNLYDNGNTYAKTWVQAVVPECKVTWQCSADSKQDKVLTEAPNIKTVPTDDDAITGPLKLVAASGLADTTEDLSPPDFTVNGISGTNTCPLDPRCGNNLIDTGEQCDGSTLPSPLPACSIYHPCTFQCSSTCGLLECNGDGTGCVPYIPPLCGNGTIDSGEQCDGTNLNGKTCQNLGYGTGNLSCSTACQFDFSQCSVHPLVVAVADSASTPLNTPVGINILNNDYFTGSPPPLLAALVNITIIANPTQGIVSLTGIATYTPKNDYKGTDTFTYKICDKVNSTNCSTAGVTINVGGTGGAVCGNGILEQGEQCDDGNLINGDGCSNTCQIPPRVEATVPHQAEENFCRNGIVDIYFDSPIDANTIEKIEEDVLTRNIIIESCTTGPLTTAKNQSILSRSLAYVKNIFQKLFAYQRQTSAQLSDCTPFDNNNFYLRWGLINEKTAAQLIPIYLLEPDQFYRVRIIGGDDGLKNLKGVNLDNSNTPVPDPNNYIFEFKTMGSATDSKSGICDVDWIDTRVYRQPYSGAESRKAEYRSDDLFTCAGKNDCNLETDYDQDGIISGNQHIYQAIARYRGEFSLKASYQWSKNDSTDPDKAVEIYNQTSLCIAGDVTKLNHSCASNADCETGAVPTGGICDQGDTSTDPYKVKNGNGFTFTTAKPVKEATAKLAIEAQAQGSFATPVQQSFTVYLLLCENPWPSLQQKFPLANLINTYNYHTYYCRDAGPPGPEGDLPAARVLVPNIANLNILENTDFEFGTLSSWVDLQEGSIFASQPVKSKIAAEGWIINTAYRQLGNVSVYDGEVAEGKLQSQAFVIEGDQLRFNLGGTNDPDVNVVFAIKSDPTQDFIDINTLSGTGSDLLVEKTIDLAPYTIGRICQKSTEALDCQGNGTCDTEHSQCTPILGIIRIEDNSEAGHIDFDNLSQFLNGTQINLRY